jgi:hypothetical protein
MDTDWIKEKVTTDVERNLKSMDIGAGMLQWPAMLYHHERGIDCFGTSDQFTTALEMEIPPTALLNDTLDHMVRNETMLFKVGFAFCHPKEQYCKKTGREIAKSKLEYAHFNMNAIIRCKNYVTISLSYSHLNEHPKKRVIQELVYKLSFYDNGVVMLIVC